MFVPTKMILPLIIVQVFQKKFHVGITNVTGCGLSSQIRQVCIPCQTQERTDQMTKDWVMQQ